MKKIKLQHLFMLFALVAIVQLFVPVQMILGQETILNAGTAYKFRTQPIDPSDPFRGKYIILRYEMNAGVSKDSLWERFENAYVYLKKDSMGFAELMKVSKTPLHIENDFVIVKTSWYDKNKKIIHFNLPFDRFYMEENKAKPAEDAFREAQRDSLPNNTYGLVYIKEGEAVLKDVLINEIPIADYVEQ